MNQFHLNRSALLGMSAAIGAMAALASVPAHAIEDNNSSVFDTLTSLIGLSSGKAAPVIDYRERAPLVLPPKMELRQPLTEGSSRAANWPQDPDVLKRQEEANSVGRFNPFVADTMRGQLPKNELMSGRAASASTGRAPTQDDGCREKTQEGWCLYMQPNALRAGNPNSKRDNIVVGEEPGRNYLTQPPTGYRRVTVQTGAGPQAGPNTEDEASPYTFWKSLNPFRKDEEE